MNPDKYNPSILSKMLPWLLLAAMVVAAVFVYAPGLKGPLLFDDIASIQNNEHIKMEVLGLEELKLAAMSHNTGMFYRPVAVTTFALNHYFFGDSTYAFKSVNLAIHLINGVLVFLLARLLIGMSSIGSIKRMGLVAVLVATAWLLHPINLTSVLYVVQRMASLSVLFVLLALVAYIKGRLAWRSQEKTRAYLFFGIVLFSALAGVLSKENALLLPFYFFLIEWIFLSRLGKEKGSGKTIYFATLGWLVIPVVLGLAFFVSMQMWGAYEARHFTLIERLLTETRVIFYYIGLILVPRPGEFGLFHDDFILSTGLFSPFTTVFSILGLIGLVYTAILMRRKYDLISFGILFFLAAHLMESTVIPLELVHEHRNYLASFGIFIGVIGGFLFIAQLRLSMPIRVSIVVIFCLFFAAVTHGRALTWQSINRLSMTMVHNHPESARSNYQAATIYVGLSGDPMVAEGDREEYKQLSVDHFTKAALLDHSEAGGLLSALMMQALDEKIKRDAFVSDLLTGNKGSSRSLILDQKLMEDVPRRLREELPSELAITNLLRMSQCEREKQCVFDKDLLDTLFLEQISNPGIPSRSYRMAAILEEMALRALSSGDLEKSVKLIQEAIDINPHMAMFKLNGAVIMASVNRHEVALGYISEVLSEPQPEAIKSLANQIKRSVEEHNSKN